VNNLQVYNTEGIINMKHKYLFVLLIIFLLIGVCSAFEFDNVKSYDERTKEVIITNAYGFGSDLAKIKLTYNTYYCDDVCSAEGTIYLYTTGKLMERLDFLKQSKTAWNSKTMPYQIYIQDGTETQDRVTYTPIHDEKTNITTYEKSTIKVEVPLWKEYNNEDLSAGEYNWKIIGYKKYDETIDWQGTWMGIKVTDWATWSGVTTFNFRMNNTLNEENNAYTWTNTSALAFGAGQVNNSVLLPEVDIGGSSFISPTGTNNPVGDGVNWTYSMWIKPVQTWNDTVGLQGILYDDGDSGTSSIILTYDHNTYNGNLTCIGGLSPRGIASYGVVFNASRFTHIGCSYNGTTVSLYINGTHVADSTSVAGYQTGGTGSMQVNSNAGGKSFYIDEFKFWNYTISDGTIQEIYNIESDNVGSISVTLTSPLDGSSLRDNGVFNETYSIFLFTPVNATYYFWKSDNSIFNKTKLNVVGLTNTTSLNINNFDIDNYKWNVKVCGYNTTGTYCDWATSNFSFSVNNIFENNVTYSNSVIEGEVNTITASFDILNPPSSIFLNYNGTNSTPIIYTNGNNYYLVSNVLAPSILSNSNITFYYLFTVNDVITSIGSRNQTILDIGLSTNCSAGSFPFLNINNYDEESLSQISGTVEYNVNLANNNIQTTSANGTATGTNISICSTANLSSSSSSFNLELRYYSTDYFYKTYNIQNSLITSIPLTVPLYYLNTSKGTQLK